MGGKRSRTHKTRGVSLENPEVRQVCPYCGEEAPTGRKYCDMGCYRAKQRSQPIEARFWPRVQKADGDGCWLWTGAKFSKGYGQFIIFRDGAWRPIGAHVVAYELATGERITDGMSVLHRCDVRACVRFDHLFKGTQKMNMEDASAKGRMNVPHKPRKLSDQQVFELRSLAAIGVPYVRLAKRFGISKVTAGRIAKGLARPYVGAQKAS